MNWKIFGATLRGLLLRHFPFITPFSFSRSVCLYLSSVCVSGRRDKDAKWGKWRSPPRTSCSQTSSLARAVAGLFGLVGGFIRLFDFPFETRSAWQPPSHCLRRSPLLRATLLSCSQNVTASPRLSSPRFRGRFVACVQRRWRSSWPGLHPLTLLFFILLVSWRASRLRRWRISSPF